MHIVPNQQAVNGIVVVLGVIALRLAAKKLAASFRRELGLETEVFERME
jgi:hypothetical protein